VKILAYDLGTTTGCAFGAVGETPQMWSETFGEAGPSHAHRFTQALIQFRKHIDRHQPNLVVIEAAIAAGPKGGAARVQVAMGLRACVLIAAQAKGVRWGEYAVQTVRKHFIGKGKGHGRNEAKAQTMKRCRMLGWKVLNDNEADAAALWDLACMKERRIATAAPMGLFDYESAKRQ
jgi:Holliday junction resolvasome RuvABC endonuclease subunit